MRQLTYYIAVSQDGFVCRQDGSIADFTFDGDHVEEVLRDFPETLPTHLQAHFDVDSVPRRFDTVLMGRHTYELGQQQEILSPYQHLRQFLFSTSIEESPSKDLTLIRNKAVEVVRELKREDGLDIWLCGGPQLASDLVSEIDNIVLKVNPFLMGSGKSLFTASFPKLQLELRHRSDYSSGFSLLEFSLPRQQP